MFQLSPQQRVIVTTCVISISASFFGFDTGSISAITLMPDFLVQFGELSELLRGFVVSVILIPSALTGILAGGIQDRISRKKTISLGCALFSLGSAISAGSTVLGVLVLGRCIAGTGEGLFLSAMVVYVCVQRSTCSLKSSLDLI